MAEPKAEAESLDSDLAARVRVAIEGESARSFALRAGLKPSTLRSILSGRRPIVHNLVSIADAAGVSVEWLATGRGEMRRAAVDPAPVDEVEQRLDAIRRALDATDRLPVHAGLLDRRDELWPVYADLQALSRDASLPDGLRAQADLYLRLAFDDRGAGRRQERRFEEIAARMKAAYAAVDDALAAVDWTPSPLLKEELRTVAFRHDMTADDLAFLLSAIKAEVCATAAQTSDR